MVCDKCQAKLGKVIVPDKWKDGARNTTGSFRQPHYGPTSSCRGRPKIYLLHLAITEPRMPQRAADERLARTV